MLAATIITRAVCVLILTALTWAAVEIAVTKAAAWLDGDQR